MSPPQSRFPGKTIAEKILSAKSSSDARAGDVAVCTLDHLMATDGSMPMTIDYWARREDYEHRRPGIARQSLR